MQVFQLEPIHERLDDPRWATSTIKEAFYITANSEEHARHQASMILLQMADMQPGQPILYSPWLDPAISECLPVTPGIEVPDGIIVTLGGQTHS